MVRHPARTSAVALAALALPLGLWSCSDSGSDPDEVEGRTVWAADFGTGEPGAESFSRPRGTTHGECDLWESDGAAFYKWSESADDGEPTRCYPVHLFGEEGADGVWRGALEGPWRFTGRFWIDLDEDAREELTSGTTFSLLTFLPSPPQDTDDGLNSWLSSTTVNVEWPRESAEPQLNVWHVPGQGEGEFERVADLPFPDERWVEIDVIWRDDGRITVRQDGTTVIRARKERYNLAGGGEAPLEATRLYAFHAGGYVSASMTEWTIGNADLRFESLQ